MGFFLDCFPGEKRESFWDRSPFYIHFIIVCAPTRKLWANIIQVLLTHLYRFLINKWLLIWSIFWWLDLQTYLPPTSFQLRSICHRTNGNSVWKIKMDLIQCLRYDLYYELSLVKCLFMPTSVIIVVCRNDASNMFFSWIATFQVSPKRNLLSKFLAKYYLYWGMT